LKKKYALFRLFHALQPPTVQPSTRPLERQTSGDLKILTPQKTRVRFILPQSA
jgi:hypothetical protein